MLSDIAADKDGNVVLCGTSYSDEKGWVFLTVKYSRSGERRWVRRLNGPGIIDWANEVVCGADGAVYVAGMYDNGGTASSDMCLVKYRADGKRLWLRTYAKSDGAYELARGSDGKLYVAGARYSEMDGGGVVVIRYRPDGTRDWVRVVGPPDGLGQHVNDLAVRSSGVCVTGQLIDIDGGDSWGFVFKLRLDGTLRWQRAVAGESTYRACGIDGDGRVTIAGWAGDDFSLRRFSAIGRPAGTAAWHGSDTGALGIGEALAVTAAGNAYATGLVHNNDTGQDVWTVGMSSAWLPLFTVSYGSPTYGDDDGDDLALATGSFCVGAVSDGSLLLIKYER